MSSRFFIDRPVFASVLSIVIVLAGLVAMRGLPIEQYPEIVPPTVVVSATYPGASAEAVAETVAAPLEQQINGVDNMLYIQSTNTSAGAMTMTVTFEIGTDPDQATINVNNRVQRALSQLPEEVTRLGVMVDKRSSSILEVITMSSDGRYDPIYISNYALVNVLDDLKRLPGVGDATLFGSKDYSMRVWLRPDKLAQYGLTPTDVAAAIREQNSLYAAGRFGDEPRQDGLAFTYSVTTQGRLADPAAFEDIILRSDENGASLRLRDVARVELGAQDYNLNVKTDGQPSVAIGIYLQPGANALETSAAVAARMAELAQDFPEGMTYTIPFDTTKFVEVSIEEVIKTFIEAMILVIAVVFLFLQNVRATLIPILAVPVSIIGAFAGMYVLGFSINLLTLFGLVLAIGIVVDDAIVVLENVERIMEEEKLPPRQAAIKAMTQVTGPVIAIVLVLCAVFVPVAFMGGLAGQMYKQFAVTIAVSVAISGLVALTLTPALCALILKPGHHRQPIAPLRLFNRAFNSLTAGYVGGVRFLLRRAAFALLLVAGLLAITVVLFQKVPGGLVPEEDQGYAFIVPILPPAASLERTTTAMEQVEDMLMAHPSVQHVTSLSGFDILAGGLKTSSGVAFVNFKDWSQRSEPSEDARVLVGTFMGMLSGIQDAMVLAFNPPPIMGMSTTGGFELYVQDRTGAGSQALYEATQQLVQAAAQRPDLAGVRTTFGVSVPQYRIEVDRVEAKALGVPIASIFQAMQATFGSLYVNDFTLFGRNFRVSLQSEADFRAKPEDLKQVFVRADSGEMIPLDILLDIERVIGPDQVDRFNIFPAAKVMGDPAPGYSSGQAIQAMEELAAEVLPPGYALAWTGSAYQERATGGTAAQALIFGIIMVFLILAAQYERWSLPLAVILAVPFALFGALLAVWLRGLNNDIYFQIGLVTLIGLAAKNAILIVEFAAMKRREGLDAMQAAIEGAKLRFRPIVMTSLAFILGCVPLAISSGAGSASRHSIGTGVIGGMLAATFIAMFFIPLFYRLIARKASKRETEALPSPAE